VCEWRAKLYASSFFNTKRLTVDRQKKHLKIAPENLKGRIGPKAPQLTQLKYRNFASVAPNGRRTVHLSSSRKLQLIPLLYRLVAQTHMENSFNQK